MNFNPMLMTDMYKISHRIMSEEGTEKIYSTLVPRSSRIKGVSSVVMFGSQGFIKEWLVDYFNDNFFNLDIEDIVYSYKRIIKTSLGENCASTKHIEDLHKLGYLPLKIMALMEGSIVPIRVPIMTIENTIPDFYWLTNFLETLISTEMWRTITSATIAKLYYDYAIEASNKTCDSNDHIPWQMHNFSYRGMCGNSDAIKTGAACLLFSNGTDTIPSICYHEKYYGADVEKEFVAGSVYATEHSIQCQYQDDEKYIERMITDVVPEGIVSVVIDGYDYWNVIDNIVPKLKSKIMKRDGKCVFRGDSGSPIDIICGTCGPWNHKNPKHKTSEQKGSIERLWEIFGGTINSKGYKVLDPHVGYIYGDAITPDGSKEIFRRLKNKGFASSNIVLGIGLA